MPKPIKKSFFSFLSLILLFLFTFSSPAIFYDYLPEEENFLDTLITVCYIFINVLFFSFILFRLIKRSSIKKIISSILLTVSYIISSVLYVVIYTNNDLQDSLSFFFTYFSGAIFTSINLALIFRLFKPIKNLKNKKSNSKFPILGVLFNLIFLTLGLCFISLGIYDRINFDDIYYYFFNMTNLEVFFGLFLLSLFSYKKLKGDFIKVITFIVNTVTSIKEFISNGEIVITFEDNSKTKAQKFVEKEIRKINRQEKLEKFLGTNKKQKLEIDIKSLTQTTHVVFFLVFNFLIPFFLLLFTYSFWDDITFGYFSVVKFLLLVIFLALFILRVKFRKQINLVKKQYIIYKNKYLKLSESKQKKLVYSKKLIKIEKYFLIEFIATFSLSVFFLLLLLIFGEGKHSDNFSNLMGFFFTLFIVSCIFYASIFEEIIIYDKMRLLEKKKRNRKTK